jgi:hypothetical protein
MSKPLIWAGAAVAVVVVAVAVWLIRPLFVDQVVDEDFPLSAGAEVPDDMDQAEVEAQMAAAAAQTEPVEEGMPDGEPVAVLTGDVVGADDSHRGTGTATVYELPDGSTILRLEDFEVTNGPQLHVFLAPLGADGTPDVHAGTDLGPLKGNIGDQNYDIPADVALDQPLAVVVYCVPFSVTFATAALG